MTLPRLALAVALFVLSACANVKVASREAAGGGAGGDDYGTKSGVFLESSIDRNSINVRRVAIVPNRLPNNLLEPERWRKSNYEIIKRELQRNGFDVVDYATAVDAFERSGLPTEDTRSSRDKYADLCQQLGADAVFIPYYGTQSFSKGTFVFNTYTFIAIATFQVFLAEKNDFLARIDATGSSGYSTGGGTLAGLLIGGTLLLVGMATAPNPSSCGTNLSCLQNISSSSNSSGTMTTMGSVAMAGGALIDMLMGGIQASRAPEGFWEDSFEEAIKDGLKPFLSAIRPGMGGGGRPMGPPPGMNPAFQQAPQRPYGQQPYGPPQGYPQQPQGYPAQQPAYPQQPAQPQPQPYQPNPYPQQPQQPQPPQPYTQPQPYNQAPPPNPYPAPGGGMPGAPQPYSMPAAPAGGCASNADCKGGRACVAGQCVSPSAAPGCMSDADCKGGRACIAGQCTAR